MITFVRYVKEYVKNKKRKSQSYTEIEGSYTEKKYLLIIFTLLRCLDLMDESITSKVIGAAIEVHRSLGPGLLEFTYEICLAKELDLRNINYQRQKPCSLTYKDLTVEGACRIDFLIENELVLEIKSIESFSDIHVSQLLTYLHLLKLRKGLLLNFNVSMLREGIRRISL